MADLVELLLRSALIRARRSSEGCTDVGKLHVGKGVRVAAVENATGTPDRIGAM